MVLKTHKINQNRHPTIRIFSLSNWQTCKGTSNRRYLKSNDLMFQFSLFLSFFDNESLTTQEINNFLKKLKILENIVL